jgi:DnaJ-class molecular chaperone|tara:strand:+ start:673 stop:1017 length:345 start_codon:yes stop_codon:yes gene_type:complete
MENQMTKNLFDGDDKIVQDVIKIFEMRSAEGMKNYGMKMEENPKSALAWAIDAQEELMDAILYIQCLKENLKKYASLFAICPNCQGRGKAYYETGNGSQDRLLTCLDCDGAGRV